MATLKNLELREKLKKLIISQARVHYGPQHPPGSVFDLVIQKHNVVDNLIGCDALLIVYPKGGTNFTHWECLIENSRPQFNEIAAMENLLKDLENADHPNHALISEGTIVRQNEGS